jgi:MFS family permease
MGNRVRQEKPSLLTYFAAILSGIFALLISSFFPSLGPLGYLISIATYLVAGMLFGYWWPAKLWRWVVLISLPCALYLGVAGTFLVSAYFPASQRGVLSVLVSLAYFIPIIALVAAVSSVGVGLATRLSKRNRRTPRELETRI